MRKSLPTIWPILLVVLLTTACSSPEIKQPINEEPISRYELISGEKVLANNDAYPPVLHADGWEQPQPISRVVNSAGLEDSPFITPDGKTLFIFFTPSAEIPAEKQILDGVTGIYRVVHMDNGWQEPVRVKLSEVGETTMEGCPFFQNNVLWFCSIRAGNYRDIDIWRADWIGEGWQNFTNAGAILNETYQVGEMHLNMDESIMYFHKPNPDQGGTYDLWQIENIDGTWTDPTVLTILNTAENDSRPALSPDGSEFWFTRTYKGTPAIYRSIWTAEGWTVPELIISQFAGEPSIDSAGNIYFTHHFFQEGKMIEADIYIAKKK